MTGLLTRPRSLALCLLLSLTCPAQPGRGALAQTAAARSDPTNAQSAPPYKNYSAPQYKGATLRSFYLPMSDGVRIAIDIALPEGLTAGAKIPAVVQLTRYWRARAGQNTPNET